MKSDIDIRAASESDFVPLCALYCKSVQCNPKGFIQDLDYHGCLISKTRKWREEGGELLVGYAERVLIALGGLAPADDGSVELCKLHVDPAWQGRGVGRRMTERLIAVARERGFGEVILHVTMTQAAAIGLYRSLGFRPVKRSNFETTVFNERVTFDTIYMSLPLGDAYAPALEANVAAGSQSPHL